MIFAVIIFIAETGIAVRYRSLDTFPTMAACQAHVDADISRLEAARAQAEASLGYPLRMVARCVNQGRAA